MNVKKKEKLTVCLSLLGLTTVYLSTAKGMSLRPLYDQWHRTLYTCLGPGVAVLPEPQPRHIGLALAEGSTLDERTLSPDWLHMLARLKK